MSLSFIVMSTKSALAWLTAQWSSLSGSVMRFCASARLSAKPSTLRSIMPTANLLCLAWRLSADQFDLMAGIAGQHNIPLHNIEGFKLKRGRWYICLKQIGWLSTSNLLRMGNPYQTGEVL